MSGALAITADETVTIADAVASYLHTVETRKRRPARRSSLATFRTHQKRIVASVGGASVANFSNASMRSFVADLASEALSPKTIAETVSFLKSSISNLVDAEGKCLFPKMWRTQFHDLPEIKAQRQPTVTAKELEDAIAAAFSAGHKLDATLWALAAGSGARISELRALRVGPSPET